MEESKKKKYIIFGCSILASTLVGAAISTGICLGVTHLSPYEEKMLYIFNLVKDNWLYEAEYDDVDKILADLMISGLDYSEDHYMSYGENAESLGLETDFNDRLSLGLGFAPTDQGIYVRTVEDGASTNKINVDDCIIAFSSTKYLNNKEIKLSEFDTGLEFYNELSNSIKVGGYKDTKFTFTIKDKSDKVEIIPSGYTTNPFYPVISSVNEDIHNEVIKVSTFLVDPTQKVSNYLTDQINKYGPIDNLIIDLTNNGGGVVNYARNLMSLFLDKGAFLYQTKNNKDKVIDSYHQKDEPIFNKQKIEDISILMNKGTASASELFACALAGNERAKLYGETSYGKGIGQNVITFKDNSTFKYTAFYTTSPKTIDGKVKKDFTYHNKGLVTVDFGGEDLNNLYTLFSSIFSDYQAFESNESLQQRFINFYPSITQDNKKYSSFEEYLYNYYEYKELDFNLDSSKPWLGIKPSKEFISALNTDLNNLYINNKIVNYNEILG